MKRINKASQKRINRAVRQANTFAMLKGKDVVEDRTEVLSTIKRTSFVRG
jgi:hypothetical protein